MKTIIFTVALFAIGVFLFKADAQSQPRLEIPNFYEKPAISKGDAWIVYPNGHKRYLKHNEILSINGPREMP